MGRFSPTVVPEVPDPLRVIDSMYSGYLQKKEGDRADRRIDITEEEADRREVDRVINRHERGYIKRNQEPPPAETEYTLPGTPLVDTDLPNPGELKHPGPLRATPPFNPAAPLFPEGSGPGIGKQPRQREGIPALHDQLKGAAEKYQPEVIANPGALIPGVNTFADRPIVAPPPLEEVPGVEYDFDPSRSREAQMLNRQTSYFDHTERARTAREASDLAGRRTAARGVGYSLEESEAVAHRVPLPRGEEPGRSTRPSFTQARDALLEGGEYFHTNGARKKPFPPGITMNHFNSLAQAVTDGEITWEEAQAEMDSWEGEKRTGGLFLPQQSFDEYVEGYGFPDRAPAGEAPEEPSGMTDEQVTEAQGYVQGISRQQAARELKDLGFTTADIRRILGG
jgi:hypothetical protein